MKSVKEIVGKYWVAYYLVYVACIVFLLSRHWEHWKLLRWDDTQPLAALFAIAAGIALAVAILVEVTVPMVLLIPPTVRAIMNRGREEGREEGRREGREEARKRALAAYKEAVARGVITDDPEIKAALLGGSAAEASDSK